MSTLLKMQKFHPLCSRCIGMYLLQNRWTVLRYLQCYENFSECCTHLILPETALFSPTPTFAKEPLFIANDCLPPCGGSGLKYSQVHYTTIYNMSPSMRREWIEISTRIFIIFPSVGLPPCGGSGLKCRIAPQYACKYWSPSMRREWIEIQRTLYHTATVWSPSMRREWIEMQVVKSSWLSRIVSLHAEGVD